MSMNIEIRGLVIDEVRYVSSEDVTAFLRMAAEEIGQYTGIDENAEIIASSINTIADAFVLITQEKLP